MYAQNRKNGKPNKLWSNKTKEPKQNEIGNALNIVRGGI
jgi:hypothetical protein